MLKDRHVSFGGFDFDLETGELRRGGERVHLAPQPTAVLRVLVHSCGELVTRERLRAEIWGDRFVEWEQLLHHSIRQIRLALGDDARRPRFVETIPRRGYSFVAPVHAMSSLGTTTETRVPVSNPWPLRAGLAVVIAVLIVAMVARANRVVPVLDSPPVVAILPFATHGLPPEAEYVSAALADGLITALASLGADNVSVISRRSAARFGATQRDVESVGRELGTTYVIEGSLFSGDGVADVGIRVVDSREGKVLWAKTYLESIDDVPALTPLVARDIADRLDLAGELGPRLTVPRDEQAGRLYWQARYLLDRPGSPEPGTAAVLLERVLEREPDFAPARIGLAKAHLMLGEIPAARSALAAAMDLGGDYPKAHLLNAHIALYVDWDRESAGWSFDRAMRLQPADAETLQAYSSFQVLNGRPALARELILRAHALDPVETTVTADLGWILYYTGSFAEAAQRCEDAVGLEPGNYGAWLCLLRARLARDERDRAAVAAHEIARMQGAGDRVRAPSSEIEVESTLEAFWRLQLEIANGRPDSGDMRVVAAGALVGLGRLEGAMGQLDLASKVGSGSLAMLATIDPWFGRLGHLPEFPNFVVTVRGAIAES